MGAILITLVFQFRNAVKPLIVFSAIPLALHGGPLWESLCYTQIGGLTFATVITLLLVPVLYAIFVLGLKIVTWPEGGAPEAAHNI